MAAPSRALNIAAWVASVLLFVLYSVFAAPPKLMGDPQAVEGFIKMGYSDAFRLFIGAAEFLGGLGLLIPRLAFWAALGLIIIMIGAVYTLVTNGMASNLAPAVIALVLLGFIAYVRRSQALFLS
jgi:hypothetical protein